MGSGQAILVPLGLCFQETEYLAVNNGLLGEARPAAMGGVGDRLDCCWNSLFSRRIETPRTEKAKTWIYSR